MSFKFRHSLVKTATHLTNITGTQTDNTPTLTLLNTLLQYRTNTQLFTPTVLSVSVVLIFGFYSVFLIIYFTTGILECRQRGDTMH